MADRPCSSRRCTVQPRSHGYLVVVSLLVMLTGGYGAVLAQPEAPRPNREEADGQAPAPAADEASRANDNPLGGTAAETREREEAANDFLGLEWGAGVGVLGSFGGERAIEKASLDANGILRVEEEGDMRPQMFLEMHSFLFGKQVKCWRDYHQNKAVNKSWCKDKKKNSTGRTTTPEAPVWGYGPFIALQSGGDNAIDALAIGMMWGVRELIGKSVSASVGIGLSFDPSVQVLGDGLDEGKPLPENEESVRYKKEGRLGWALMSSFKF